MASSGPSSASIPSGMNAHARSLHETLGGGQVADIVLWRNWKLSAIFLGGIVVTWFLFEALEYTFVSLVCHTSMIIMLLHLLWTTSSRFFNWNPPNADYFKVPEAAFQWLIANFNCLLQRFLDISSGKNLIQFSAVIGSMWMLAVIGNYISFLNLISVVLLCLLTGPAAYERWGNQGV